MWYALCLAVGGLVPFQRFLRKLGAAVVSPKDGVDETVFIRGLTTPVLQEQEQLCELALFAREHPAVARWLEAHTLEELLEQPGESPQLVELASRIRVHLDRFGHQIRSLDFATPGLAEEPGRLAIGLRCYLEPDAVRPSETRARLDEQRERAVAQVRASSSGRKLRLFNAVLARAHAHVVTRDTASFHLQMAWPLLRSALLELGRRLAERSILAQPDDVFFVTRDELWGTTRGEPLVSRETVAERRAVLQERAEVLPPPAIPPIGDAAWTRAMRWPLNLRELLRSDGDRHILVGTPASPGRIQARARVLGFPSEHARLERGEVLVAVTTTPDWTPLFARAGAVVTDVGAVTSHSSVVAREYGIPAVVATQTATSKIRDGQLVTVDGSEGRVYLQ
jgi:pyruvate,water dikinase